MTNRWILIMGVLLSRSLAGADDSDPALQRLAAMRQRAESLRLRVGDHTDLCKVETSPLFRYNDPAHTTTDGTLWLWTVNELPAAAVCLFNDSREGFQWNFELVSLSDSTLHVDGIRSVCGREPENPSKRKSLLGI